MLSVMTAAAVAAVAMTAAAVTAASAAAAAAFDVDAAGVFADEFIKLFAIVDHFLVGVGRRGKRGFQFVM